MMRTNAERLLLEALRAAVHGVQVDWQAVSGEDWNALMELAAAHKALPLVVQAAYACPAAAQWDGFAQAKRLSRMQVAGQTLRTAEFRELWGFLERKGLRPLVVKGALCRALYPNGALRQSADEDLYIRPEDFARCCAALREFGMACPQDAQEETDFEIGWRKPGGTLYIELHRSLFEPGSDALGALPVLFDGALERAEPYEADGMTLCSLLPQEHLLYLLLHAYKHFIYSGFGIRQICDAGLWAQSYAARIDFGQLREQLERVHAAKFAAAVLAVAEDELGIAIPERWEKDIDYGPMLDDVLRAGVYGSADRSRLHSASLTLRAVGARRTGGRGGVWRSVFPRAADLRRTYPALKEHPALLPYYWCKRLAAYRRETKHTEDDSAAESLRLARERKKLLRRYGIL